MILHNQRRTAAYQHIPVHKSVSGNRKGKPVLDNTRDTPICLREMPGEAEIWTSKTDSYPPENLLVCLEVDFPFTPAPE
jgi:hypothetical protein